MLGRLLLATYDVCISESEMLLIQYAFGLVFFCTLQISTLVSSSCEKLAVVLTHDTTLFGEVWVPLSKTDVYRVNV